MSPFQFTALVFLAAIWGASFLFMRIATPEFGPFALIAIRVSTASLVLLPIWFYFEPSENRKTALTHWHQLLVVGLFNSAIPFTLFAYSTLHITGGLSSIMNSTATIWTAVVAWVWLGRKPSLQTAIGLAVGLIGVVVLVYSSAGSGTNKAALGAFAAASAAVLYGIAANFISEKLAHVSSLTNATFSLVAAAIVLMPLAVVFAPTETISSKAWAAVITMGVVSTAIANIIFFWLLAAVGPTKTVAVTFLIPVFGVFWGALFINEQVTTSMLIGGSIVLAGIALVTNIIRFKRAA